MSGSKSSDGSFARAATLLPEAQGDHPLGLTVHTLPEAAGAVALTQLQRDLRQGGHGVASFPIIGCNLLLPDGRVLVRAAGAAGFDASAAEAMALMRALRERS